MDDFATWIGSDPQPKTKKATKPDERGCEFCPLNEIDGVQKIFGEVTGKDLAIFAQSPGPEENIRGKELIGPSGKWWWSELKRIGYQRQDVDIQNVLRCMPADLNGDGSLKMRSPTPKEIKCCSLHTDNILPKLKARYILVLGQIAAKALLNTRSLPEQKIFWDRRLRARVYLLDHPAFFLRGGSVGRLKAFRDTLDRFAKDVEDGVGDDSDIVIDPYRWLKQQDFKLVMNKKQAEAAYEELWDSGKVLAVDIESDEIDGVGRVFAVGFCHKPGHVYVFVMIHGEQSREDGDQVRAVAKRLLEDPQVGQCYHHGCSDVVALWEYEGICVPRKSFVHDTLISEYFRFPGAKAYGLASVAENRFPEIGDYKNIVIPGLMSYAVSIPPAVERGAAKVKLAYLSKNDLYHLSRLSLDTLRLYNGGDCHLTKSIQIDNRKYVPQALMDLYVDLSFILHDMEPNGPLFDYEQCGKLDTIYPELAKVLKAQLQNMIDDVEFNPASPVQVYTALYEKLQLKSPFSGKPNTQKATMQMLAQRHQFPSKVLEYRHLAKAISTYIRGYRACADKHDGRLRTRWKIYGTRTGRLSSGGDKEKKDPGIINLQNVANNEHIQNLLIADKDWRRVYNLVWQVLARFGPNLLKYWVVEDDYMVAVAKAKKAGEKYRGEEPKPSPQVVSERILAGKKIEAWLRKTLPDFRTFLMLDYGQVEIRVAAQLSGDEALIADCQESDIHSRVGSVLTGWDAEKIKHDKYTRTRTKNVHFGVLFGQSEDGTVKYVISMAPPEEQLKVFNMDNKEREKYENEIRKQYRRYFERYTGIKDFIENQREFARQHGYVETVFGMKRHLDIREDRQDEEIVDEETGAGYWANIAVNSPVQGSAHQLLVCGLVNIKRQPEKYKVLGVPVMDVHDALYFNVRVLDLLDAYKQARYLMEHESLNTVKSDFPDIDWRVPIVTEAEAGLSLGCKVDVDDKLTVGDFLIQWCRQRKAQLEALDQELWKIAGSTVPSDPVATQAS